MGYPVRFVIDGAKDVSDPGDKEIGIVRLELELPALPHNDAKVLDYLFPNTQHMIQRALLAECLIVRTNIRS